MKIKLIAFGLITCLSIFLIFSCGKDDINEEIISTSNPPNYSLRISLKSVNINGIYVEDKPLWCRVFADVNGDSKSDMIWRSGRYIYVSLSNGYSFQSPVSRTYWNPNGDFKLADVNGDGKADLIGRTSDEIHVALSTGNYFLPSESWTYWTPNAEYKLADVNGDGKSDLIGRLPSGDEIHVALSTGNSFIPSVSWTYWTPNAEYELADVNGDGKADLIGRLPLGDEIHVELSTGNSFLPSTSWPYWDPIADYNLADVDGDGKSDLIGRLPAGDHIHVALSTGSSFLTSTTWSYWNPNAEYNLLDANGDGKADLIGRLLDDFEVGLSTGNNFASSTKWSIDNFTVLDFINDINNDLLRQDIDSICAFHPRVPRAYDSSTELDFKNLSSAARYIENQFQIIGYITERESVSINGIYCGDNIIATKRGEFKPNSFIEFTSHYDGGFNVSPGAKDNACGVASVIEIARSLFHYNNRNSLRFIAFTSEEYGVPGFGSNTHVLNSISKGEEIIAALNIDTPGTGNVDNYGNFVYYDDINNLVRLNKNELWNRDLQKEDYMSVWYRSVASYEISQLFRYAIKAYNIPLHEIVPEYIGKICQSDELAYALTGNVATTSLGDWSNSQYHTGFDKPANVNINNVCWIAQANMAVGITLDH